MKRIFIVLALIVSAILVNAQNEKNAIGLRLGGGDGVGTEISFQHNLAVANRLEFDLGMLSGSQYSAWGVVGLYQWVWKIDNGFNWYAGAGGRIGTWNWDNSYHGSDGGGFLLAAAGNVGIEYTFPVRIQLGLDFRPEINLINHENAFGNSIGLSIRYKF
jgi:hypothetical protein